MEWDFVVSQSHSSKMFIKGNVDAHQCLVAGHDLDQPSCLCVGQSNKDSSDSSLNCALGCECSPWFLHWTFFCHLVCFCETSMDFGNNQATKHLALAHLQWPFPHHRASGQLCFSSPKKLDDPSFCGQHPHHTSSMHQ